MQGCNVIAKGSFSEYKFNDFVSLRQYLLVREGNDKFLLLKLCNDSEYSVTGIKLSVEQLDVRGNSIAKDVIEWKNFSMAPGEKVIPEDKIPMKETCVEVKINLLSANYGDYFYQIKSNELIVTYDKNRVINKKDYSEYVKGKKPVSTEREFKIPKTLVTVAMILVTLSLIASFIHLLVFKKNNNRFLWSGITYEFLDESQAEGSPIVVTGFNNVKSDLYIPKDIEGYPIVGIKSGVFSGNTRIKTLTIDANMEIPKEAFINCKNLETVELGGALVIGESAFSGCKKLTSVKAYNLDDIKTGAFNQCESLATLEISNQNKSLTIASNVFDKCESLNVVTIDQTVDYIKSVDFLIGLDNLQTLSLKNFNNQENVSRPLSSLFGGFLPTNLESVEIKDIDKLEKGFSKDFVKLSTVKLGGLKDTVIYDDAFSGCTSLSLVDFVFEDKSLNVTSVGANAFKGTAITSFDATYLTEIGAGAFADNTKLETVLTEASIDLKKIGEGAFSGCTTLKSFTLPSKATAIEKSTFSGCLSLSEFNLDSRTSLKEIKSEAFANCISLTNMTIPNTVLSLGDKAFAGCVGIQTLTISNRLNSIGEEAFKGCVSLTDVKLSNRLLTIGKGAFLGCDGLQEITVPFVGGSRVDNTYFGYIFGAENAQENVTPYSVKKVTVLEGKIDSLAFYGQIGIKEVVISEKTEEIGASAFEGCLNLRKIHLPSTLKVIDDSAFSGCHLLLEVFDNSQLRIKRGDESFGGIAKNALAVYVPGDKELEKTTVDGFEFICVPEEGWYVTDYVGEESIAVMPDFIVDQENIIYDSFMVVPYLFEKRVDVQEITLVGVKELGSHAFENNTVITKITVDQSCLLDSIEDNSFSGCTSLTKVEFLNLNLKTLNNHVFDSCSALTEIQLPEGVTEIGEYVFSDCSNLVSIVLPTTLTKVGVYAFNRCANLSKLELGEGIVDVGFGALSMCNALKEITLPFIGDGDDDLYAGYVFGLNYGSGLDYYIDKITVLSAEVIADGAFHGFKNLKSVVFDQGIQRISTSSFYGCESLTSVIAPSISIIEERAFSSCKSLALVNLNGVKEVGNQAFSSTALVEAVFSSELTTLGDNVFSGCASLTKVDLSRASACTIIPKGAFASCLSLSEVYLPYAQTISQNAFYECTALSTININGTQKIENGAFMKSGLTSIVLPAILSSMGEGVFNCCESLKQVVINNSSIPSIPVLTFNGCNSLSSLYIVGGYIREIGNNAFSNCSELTQITLPASVESIGDNAFDNCSKLSTIKLSDSLTTISDTAFNGCVSILEIYNPGSLNIVRGSYEFSGIASNAIIVHDSLSAKPLKAETISGMKFYFAETEGECCLYSYSGTSSVLKFNSVTLNGRIYSNYWIYKNAFANNQYLTEVDTGVVSEISNRAFSDCSNLRKVTVSTSLTTVKYDAFNNCTNLWEVRDNNLNFDLTKGGSDCGGVAYYALAINDSVLYTQEGDFNFVYYGGNWYLYGNLSGDKIVLPDSFVYSGTRITNYSLFEHPNIYGSGVLFNCSAWTKVVVPTSVKNVKANVFNFSNIYNLPVIYYKGNSTQWQNVLQFTSSYLSIYYHSECVHNSETGSRNWTWVNDDVSTADTQTVWECYLEPTCTKEGREKRICETCNVNFQERKVDKLPHEWTDWKVDEDSTCTKTGKKSRYCVKCSESQTGVIYKKSHDMTDWRVVTDSTCTSYGQEERHCKNCSTQNQTRDIALKPHEYKILKNNNYTHWYECSCGAKSGTENHKGGTATCTEKAKCSVCNTEYGSLKSHDMTDWSVVTDATCTEKGQEERHCKNCSTQNEFKDIDIIPHSFGADDKCTVCGKSSEEDEEI